MSEAGTEDELCAPAARRWMPIAALLRPQGRRGELLAERLSDLPEVFTAGPEVYLTPAGAVAPAPGAIPRTLEEHWFPTGKNAGRVVVKLSGCESISEAEALAGQQLLVATEQLPELDADTYFVADLLGCSLFDGDKLAGTVVDIEFPTAPDGRTRLADAAPLLAVELAGGSDADEPVLVPFIRAWLREVDTAGRRVTMQLPEGLLEGGDGDGGGDSDMEDEA